MATRMDVKAMTGGRMLRLPGLGFLPWLICLVAVLAAGWRMLDGLTLIAFPDEWENVIGSMIMQAGGVMYRDFVISHGPLILIYSHLYGVLFGWGHPNDARLITVALCAVTGVMIALSPGLRGPSRPLAVALFAGWLAVVWLRQGLFMLSFYPIAGALAGMILAGFVVPAWRAQRVPVALAVIAGVSLAALIADAYSFGPSVVLLLVSGAWPAWRRGDRQAVIACLAGLVLGGLAILAYLLIYSDILGYLAFHVAESQANYARYIGFGWGHFLGSLLPGAAPQQLVQGLVVVCAAGALVVFVALDGHRRRSWPVSAPAMILGVAGIVLLNARGEAGFQNGALVIAAVALAALAGGHLLSVLPDRVATLATGAVVLLLAASEWWLRPAIFTPYGADGASVAALGRWRSAGPSDSPAFQRIRQVARPDERILILVYQPGSYVAAGRLPMNGFYTYFPWDADYARAPWFGRQRDLCTALATAPPPVIVYDDWHVWGYDPHVYMPCLFDVLRTQYGPPETWPGLGDLYVRRDRLQP